MMMKTKMIPLRYCSNNTALWVSMMVLVVQILIFQSKMCTSLSPNHCSQSVRIGSSCTSSLLFQSESRLLRHQKRQQQRIRSPRRSTTALNMVLTTPESIIEQASTVTLLDDLINESVRTSPRRPIHMQFDPSSGWIWRRWKGTVFSETWKTCVYNMAYALIIYFLFSNFPQANNYLNGFDKLWGQMLSITTFTLTFFVNQSYALWRKCTELSRRLQGRLHDIGMNLASHAARKNPEDEKSTYTVASRQILELMSRYIRLFNLLVYASFTRSHRPILTPRGMRRLVERGLMTTQEREVLTDANIPVTQRHSAILMWMIRIFREGIDSGHIRGNSGFEQQTMEKFHVIRAQFGGIGDELQGRMPLAYAHIVQVLVDVILWLYPIMSFSIGMSPLLVIAGTGILTISYQGLFDLAKQFLDPYDNENYGKGEDPLCVDTLIAETNAGSVRWINGFNEMPFSAQRLYDGKLQPYLLPTRGYTVEELAQMEEEKKNAAAAAALVEEEMQQRLLREEEEEQQRKLLQETEDKLNDEAPVAAQRQTSEEVDDNTIIDGDIEESVNSVGTANLTTATPDTADTTIATASVQNNGTLPVDDRSDSNTTTTAAATATTTSTTSLSQDADSVDEGTRAIHKVTTLANGKPVTFDAADSPKPTIPLKAVDDYLGSLSGVNDNPADYKGGVGEGEGSANKEKEIDVVETLKTISLEEKLMKKVTKTSDHSEKNDMSETVAVVNGGPVEMEIEDDDILQMDQREEEVDMSSVGNDFSINEGLTTTNVQGYPQENPSVLGVDGIQKESIISRGGDNATIGSTNELDFAPMQSLNQTVVDGEAPGEPAVESTTMTMEDFNEEVSKIMEAVEEEMLETEAILNAKPGYDVEWDYDENQVASKEEEENENDVLPAQEGVIDSADLEILGMDEDDENDCILVEEDPLSSNEKMPEGASVSERVLTVNEYQQSLHQPRSSEEEANLAAKYASIESLEERAFRILLDLGMIDETP